MRHNGEAIQIQTDRVHRVHDPNQLEAGFGAVQGCLGGWVVDVVGAGSVRVFRVLLWFAFQVHGAGCQC